jgi:hypothetical protein
VKLATVAERPDLVEPGWLATSDVIPGRYWEPNVWMRRQL